MSYAALPRRTSQQTSGRQRVAFFIPAYFVRGARENEDLPQVDDEHFDRHNILLHALVNHKIVHYAHYDVIIYDEW
jgi:hypothetical protein